MDLVAAARKLYIAMDHTTREGKPKILKRCHLPLTGAGVVDCIVTEMGFMRVAPEGLVLEELAAPYSVAEVQAATEAHLHISPALRPMPGE